MVDDDMYEFLKQYKWRLDSSGYAKRTTRINGIKRTVFIHHIVLGEKLNVGFFSDHKNGVRLDNRKTNLRIVTKSQNAKNFKGWGKKKSSIFKGVFPRPGNHKWRVIIVSDGKRFSGGDFGSEIEAAKKYNDMALKLHGEFARLNNLNNKRPAGQNA